MCKYCKHLFAKTNAIEPAKLIDKYFEVNDKTHFDGDVSIIGEIGNVDMYLVLRRRRLGVLDGSGIKINFCPICGQNLNEKS